jgi:hypothetical protein
MQNSCVPDGVVAVPVMTVMMLMTAKPRVMGKFTINGWLRWLGWTATSAMAACSMGMVVGWFFYLRGSANLLLRCGVTVLQSVAGCSGALPFERRIARPAGNGATRPSNRWNCALPVCVFNWEDNEESPRCDQSRKRTTGLQSELCRSSL